jgi:hypothetical protein
MKTVADSAGRTSAACVVLAIAWFMMQTMLSPVCVAQEFGLRFANQPTEPILPPPPAAEYYETIPPPSAPATELIPPPPQASIATEGSLPDGCLPAPQTPPLASLTIDIAPRKNEEFVSDSELPENCAKYVYTQERFQQFGLSCATCQMSVCELLELANYYHRPLYFEERALEKCGIRSCWCQPAKSACEFYGGALMLPCKMIRQCPCSTCVPDGPCN